MKNLYNTIKQNLKAGLNVVVKDSKGNEYCAMSPSKDMNGNYRDSGWWGSIEESKQWIGCYCGDSKEYWNDKDLEIVEVYRPEFEPFKIGQKVRLLDSIKKTEDWDIIKDYFPDMKGEIKKVCNNDILGKYYKVNVWHIGHEYLAPLVEQEDNVALEAIKLLEEKGYKIVKK